jgi:hypothetical protein
MKIEGMADPAIVGANWFWVFESVTARAAEMLKDYATART